MAYGKNGYFPTFTANPTQGAAQVIPAAPSGVMRGDGPPEGVVAAQAPALYYNDLTGALYRKSNADYDSTGWVAIVSEPSE